MVNRFRRKLPGGPEFPADRRMGYPVFRGWQPIRGVEEMRRVFDPSVAIVQGPAAVPLSRAFLDADIPAVLFVRDVKFELLEGRIEEHPKLLVMANSRFTARRVREEFGVEASVVAPLVRPEPYRTRRSGDTVLFVNPHPLKGVEIAFSLAEKRPDVPFLFLEGWKQDPERRRAYVERAAKLPNVTWHEPVSDMREMYSRARLVLAPSRWEEAWGRVATEAQLSGIPVLASRRGGLPESVGPGGILVDHDAPIGEWVAALAKLWDDPAAYERYSRAAMIYSRRPEIQPDYLVTRFRGLVADHLAALDVEAP